MSNKNYYAIIMAGGVGSRFWPVSTEQNPKQFHDMLDTGDTLIQKTYQRLENIAPSENIFISTNKKYESLVLEQLTKATKDSLILEPAMRNTAPCILYAALKIHKSNPEGVMIVAPSDHWIEDEPEFTKKVNQAFEFCSEKDALMTLGIQPNNPNTGYGYIKFEGDQAIKKVAQFTEKPNKETAIKFVDSGEYLWNAGIFVWSVKSIINSFKKNLPEMYELFKSGIENYNTNSEHLFIEENYNKAENISIDFGILEKASNVYTLPVDFGWNDLGTWGSLHNKLSKDSSNNVKVGGDIIFQDASNNMIRTDKNKKVIVSGLEDFIIIEKDDVLVICPKSEEQKIKELRKKAETEFGKEYI